MGKGCRFNDRLTYFLVKFSALQGAMFSAMALVPCLVVNEPPWWTVGALFVIGAVIGAIRGLRLFHRELRMVYVELATQMGSVFVRRSLEQGVHLGDVSQITAEILDETRRALGSRLLLTIDLDAELSE